jgi:hypothetical protein
MLSMVVISEEQKVVEFLSNLVGGSMCIADGYSTAGSGRRLQRSMDEVSRVYQDHKYILSVKTGQ